MSNAMDYEEKGQGGTPSGHGLNRDGESFGSYGATNYGFGVRGHVGAQRVQGHILRKADARSLQTLDDDYVAQFRKAGKRGPMDVQLPTIGLGGFSVEYDPVSEVAWFTIRASVEFIDGIVVDMAKGEAVAMHKDLKLLADRLNGTYKSLPLIARVSLISLRIIGYHWTKAQEQAFTN